jgi:predicted MFS family arabinose efflux permease
MSLPDLPPRTKSDPTMSGALREGWGYFSSQPWILAVTAAFAVNNGLNMGVWQILGPVIANDTIGAEAWGVVLSACGVGALSASAVMVKLTVRRPMQPALASMALAAVPLILLGAGANTFWLATASVAGSCAVLGRPPFRRGVPRDVRPVAPADPVRRTGISPGYDDRTAGARSFRAEGQEDELAARPVRSVADL